MKKKRTAYTSPLRDEPVYGELDPRPDETATFYAAFDEQEAPPRTVNWLCAGFIAALVLSVWGVLWLRALPLFPAASAVETLAPSAVETPAPEAAVTALVPLEAAQNAAPLTQAQDEAPLPLTPMQAPEAAVYTRTALLVDGKKRGVLVSREAAEALLSEICAYYEAQIRAEYEIEGTLESVIDNEITCEDAPDTPDEALMSSEAMFTLLTEEKPLTVLCTETHAVAEPIPCQTESEKDKYLLTGTSIVVSPGEDGQVTTLRTTLYKNGRQRTESEEEVREEPPRERVVRVGAQKITGDDEPGRREGRRGPETELLFQSPLGEEDGAAAEIVSNYGQRNGVLHLGLDYETEAEQPPVLASCAGTVICVMERGGYGLMVELDHGGGFVTRYAHLAAAAVARGETVEAGQVIGMLGQSGNAERPTLHFELRIDGEAYNPRYYLD